MTVDLPAPFCPSSARTSPARKSNETSRTACVPPKDFDRPATDNSGLAPDSSAPSGANAAIKAVSP